MLKLGSQGLENKVKYNLIIPFPLFCYSLKNLIHLHFIKANEYLLQNCTLRCLEEEKREGGGWTGNLSCFTDVDFKFPPGNSLGARA